MKNSPRSLTARRRLLLALLAASTAASAADRRFVPVPNSEFQKLQVINGATIISAAGRQFHAGATIAPASKHQAWLSVSIKNNSKAAVAFDDGSVQIISGDKPLPFKPAESVIARDDLRGPYQDECASMPGTAAGSPGSTQINCNIDRFNLRQSKRTAGANGAPLERPAIPPGVVLARQFQLELPKRSKTAPATLKVSVTVESETISFEFNELN